MIPPSGWTRSGSNPYSWDIGTGIYSHSGSYYAHVLPDPAQGAQNEILYSPAFFTTGGTVSFYSAGNTVYCYSTYNNCDLEIWVVKGSWDAGSGNDINIGTVDALWDFSFSYFPATFDFTPYVTGGQTIRIAFRYVGKAGFQAAEVLLDDIQIKYSP